MQNLSSNDTYARLATEIRNFLKDKSLRMILKFDGDFSQEILSFNREKASSNIYCIGTSYHDDNYRKFCS